MTSPDINTEDFSAAVDYLVTNPDVDPEKVGIIGICGWGGIAVNAAAADPRIKATLASTMYDMSRVSANGYFDAKRHEQARYWMYETIDEQLRKHFYDNPEIQQQLARCEADVYANRRSSFAAASLVLATYFSETKTVL